MKKNLTKAIRLSHQEFFPKLTKRQIQEIAEDYRDYLYHYLRLHLSKDDFNMLVSTPYTVWEGVPFTPPVKKSGYYYHEVLEEVRKATKCLSPDHRLCFFLGAKIEYMNKQDETALRAAYDIYSFADEFGMEILRNYFYEYADSYFADPVEFAWKDNRFEKYLDEYAESHPEEIQQNPWNFPELERHYWPWREKLAWYRQKCKSAVIRTVEESLISRETILYRIMIWDQNVPAFVDNDKILFTVDFEKFRERWLRLGVYDNIKKALLDANVNKSDMLCKGTAHIYAAKTFIVEDAWFTAIDWFGHHRKFHVNHWEVCVQWISFRSLDSTEVEYFRIISHQAQGVCRIEIFPQLLVAVEECRGNHLLECEAPFKPHYSMNIPRNNWPRPTFDDFADNHIRSICFTADDRFTDEADLQDDAKAFTITGEVMRELFEEV